VINLSVCASVCLSASISLELLDRSTQTFVCISPVAVARSSSGDVVLCYALLWMTSCLAVVGRMSVCGLSVAKYSAPHGVARPGRSLLSVCFYVSVGL